MGKKGVAVLFLSLVLISGCETTKGIASGIGSTVEGAGKDTVNFVKFIKAVDKWVKEKAW